MNKKILIFIPSIEDGGVEKNLYIVSNYLEKKGKLVEVLTCNNDKAKMFDKRIKFLGTKNIFWQNKSRKIKYLVCLIILFLNLLFRKDKPLIFAFQANIYAVIVSKIMDTKIITRSNSAPSGWSNNKVKNILYKFLINLADDVMVNSNEFKKHFYKKFKIEAKCIYNPFDKKIIYNKLKKKKVIRYFKKNKINIVAIGRLTDQKDHITLLKSIKILKSNSNINLLILGKGKEKKNLEKFINESKLNDKVKLLGYSNNPYQYLLKSDIVVLSSKYEGLPNVLLEAQFLKKYIISTNCPTGPKEILLNGKAGDLFNIGDYKKLSFFIKNYHQRKKIINKKIIIGYKNFNRFDYELNCKKYLELINKNS